MAMVYRTHLRQFIFTPQLENLSHKKGESHAAIVRRTMLHLGNASPVLLYYRPLKFVRSVTVRLSPEFNEVYLRMKKYLSLTGLCTVMHDYIINHKEYNTAESALACIGHSARQSFASVDQKIKKDITLTPQEKNFLLSLTLSEREILYEDRDLLAMADIEED